MKYAVLAAAAFLSFSAKANAADVSFDQGVDVKGVIQDIQANPADDIPLSLPARAGDGQAGAVTRDMDYVFDVPVQANGNVIESIDTDNNFMVHLDRNAYGNYAVKLMLDGDSVVLNAYKTAGDTYVLRGDEVNLTFKRSFFGGYYDVSGDVPMPNGSALSARVNVDPDGTMRASGDGYDLTLGRYSLSGQLDSSVFSQADAACLMAFSMAVNSDKNNVEPWHPVVLPVWHPYHPYPDHYGPWHHHPVHPYNPVHPVGPQPYHPVNPQPYHPVNPQPYHPVGPQPYHPVNPQPYHPVNPQPYHPVNPGGHGGFNPGGHGGFNPGGHGGFHKSVGSGSYDLSLSSAN